MIRSARVARSLLAAAEFDTVDFWTRVLHASANPEVQSAGDLLEERDDDPVAQVLLNDLERRFRWTITLVARDSGYPPLEAEDSLRRALLGETTGTAPGVLPQPDRLDRGMRKWAAALRRECLESVILAFRHRPMQARDLTAGQTFYHTNPEIRFVVLRQLDSGPTAAYADDLSRGETAAFAPHAVVYPDGKRMRLPTRRS
jgi:hypothetical protein